MIKFEDYSEEGKDIIKKVISIINGLSSGQVEVLRVFFNEFKNADILISNICDEKLGED